MSYPDDRSSSFASSGNLPFVFKQLGGLIESQMSDASHLDSKASSLFAVATTVIGIVVPLMTGLLIAVDSVPNRELLFWLALIPVSAYCAAAWGFYSITRLQTYYYANDPEYLRKELPETDADAYRFLIDHIEACYEWNQWQNQIKTNRFDWLVWAVVLQALLAAIWGLTALGFSLWA